MFSSLFVYKFIFIYIADRWNVGKIISNVKNLSKSYATQTNLLFCAEI